MYAASDVFLMTDIINIQLKEGKVEELILPGTVFVSIFFALYVLLVIFLKVVFLKVLFPSPVASIHSLIKKIK